MNAVTPTDTFAEKVSDNIIIWRNSFIKSGLTLSVIGFAIAFFSQSTMGMIGFGIGIAVGALGSLNQRDLHNVNQFDKDIRRGVRSVQACSTGLKSLKSRIKNLRATAKTLNKTLTLVIPTLLTQATYTASRYLPEKASYPTVDMKAKDLRRILEENEKRRQANEKLRDEIRELQQRQIVVEAVLPKEEEISPKTWHLSSVFSRTVQVQ